jgi:sulfite reductase (ferredoxin)
MNLMTEHLIFPCREFSGDVPAARLLGLYPRVQDGLWMQRIRALGGNLTAGQWRAVAAVSQEFTPGTPLHLTTRQDVEVHDLPAALVPAAQQTLAQAGLTGLGAGGDTLRNTTVCPCSGAASGVPDLLPLARQVEERLAQVEGIFALPRKFKVSFSACEQACGRPWINDLGFVVHGRSGAWRFRVIAGGSLGPRPATGIQVFDALTPDDVLPCVVAMVRLFAEHGDREHRGRARLRHVRERVGDERFVAMAREALDVARKVGPWPRADLSAADGVFGGRKVLIFANGDVTPGQAAALADLAEREDLRVRVGLDHHVMIFGRDTASVARAVADHGGLERAATPQPSVVACPGTRWCKHGLIDTNEMADRIRELGMETLGSETTVRISGCPNGCAHSAVADVGLIGVRVREGEVSCGAYHLLTGGGVGRNKRLATPIARGVSAEALLAWLDHRGKRVGRGHEEDKP